MSITLALSKESIDADGKEASYSCYTPVTNLFQLTTGRTNELRKRRGLSCVDAFPRTNTHASW